MDRHDDGAAAPQSFQSFSQMKAGQAADVADTASKPVAVPDDVCPTYEQVTNASAMALVGVASTALPIAGAAGVGVGMYGLQKATGINPKEILQKAFTKECYSDGRYKQRPQTGWSPNG